MHSRTGLAGHFLARVDARQFRLLRRAVLCSLLLHALLLAVLAAFRDHDRLRAPPLPALTAHLAKPKPPPPPPPKVDPPPPRPAPAARAAPRPQPAPAPAPLPVLEPVKPAASAAPTAPPAPLAPAAPVAAAVPTLAAPAPAPAASGPDPASVARFRLELMDAARRYKRYPRIAQDNNWEGRVELRIAYAENGAIASLTVKKGAGRQVLDEEAQAMIRSAQAQVAVPPALRGKAFVLEIPVDFFLRDDAR